MGNIGRGRTVCPLYIYREVVHYSECPLLEVPLYCSQIQPNLSCQEAVRDYILFKMALYSYNLPVLLRPQEGL